MYETLRACADSRGEEGIEKTASRPLPLPRRPNRQLESNEPFRARRSSPIQVVVIQAARRMMSLARGSLLLNSPPMEPRRAIYPRAAATREFTLAKIQIARAFTSLTYLQPTHARYSLRGTT